MPDWTKSMQQTFEYYTVDPSTWQNIKLLDNVTGATIKRDLSNETLGSATINMTGDLDESYVRSYLVTIQNGVKEKHPLGTHLVQTPSIDFDGKIQSGSRDAYTPLLELKENPTPIGYYIPKGENIMNKVISLTKENLRAPVVGCECNKKIEYDFISNTDDKWITFLSDLAANAEYSYDIDEMGRILFKPIQDIRSLQPIWTYSDDNSSILYPEVSVERDLYGIPNVVEVIYSKYGEHFYVVERNDDPNSPISTVNRGREIIHRVVDPEISGIPSEEQIKEYAKTLIRNISSLEYSVSYTHAYCPVRLGDCVRLDYPGAGLDGVKAKVISQSIKCEPGCPVTEKAVFTVKLWG